MKNAITIQEFQDTFEGRMNFTYDLERAILAAFPGSYITVSTGYVRFGKVCFRVKDHAPRYTRVIAELEDERIEKLIDIRVGDDASHIFGNDDDRDNLLAEYPDSLLEIVVNEGDSVSEVLAKIIL